MARRWIDPRSGTTWLVDAMPFDMGPSPDPALPAPMGWTMMFVSGLEHRALPVGYDLGTHLTRLKDMELIALLDAAAMEG